MDCKFHIGQKVVAIVNHSTNQFKKGQVFKVLDISIFCKCGYCIKINNDNNLVEMYCTNCNVAKDFNGKFFGQELFAPVQEISDFTYNEAIEMFEAKKVFV